MKRNPKQAGSNLFDCIPQPGPCPINCNQCFYNRPGAFYLPIEQSHFPSMVDVGDGIVRVNTGNDSNNDRDFVIASTKVYPRKFYNTSVPKFDFPGPVVFTANPKEEEPAVLLDVPDNVMFVRVRVSPTNLELVECAVDWYAELGVPIVLTFMAYYDQSPPAPTCDQRMPGQPNIGECYEWRVRHINSYWCPTQKFIKFVTERMDHRLVSVCSAYCRDCQNCETYYIQTEKRLRGE